MSQDELYLRSAELIIGSKSEDNFPKLPGNAKSFLSDLVIDDTNSSKYKSGFRISFNIEKNDDANANKGTVSVYNISQSSRSFIENENLITFLKAGYINQISTIFFGDIQDRKTERNNSDVITTLEIVDQGKLLDTANVQIGLGPGATNIQAFSAAESALQLIIPPRQKNNLPIKRYTNGYSYTGTAIRLLEKLAEEIDYNFSIQDGEIQILKNNESTNESVVVVSPNSGLIGTPTKTQNGVEFSTLINPDIRIGRLIKLESKQIQNAQSGNSDTKASQSLKDSGIFLLPKKIVIQGDTQEGLWQMNIEGITPEED